LCSLGDLQAFDFGGVGADELQEPPFGRVFLGFGDECNTDANIVALAQNEPKMRLMAAEAVDGVGDDDIHVAGTDALPQRRQGWPLEQLGAGVRVAEDADNVIAALGAPGAARLLLRGEGRALFLARAHTAIDRGAG
jgi:hypothetical protein